MFYFSFNPFPLRGLGGLGSNARRGRNDGFADEVIQPFDDGSFILRLVTRLFIGKHNFAPPGHVGGKLSGDHSLLIL